MKRSLCLFAFALLVGGAAVAQSSDGLIIAGGGVAGKWDTEIELANPTADPLHVGAFIKVPPLGMPCPPNCSGTDYTIPGHGTVRALASDFIGAIFPGPQMIHIEAPDGGVLPVVHARAISTESESQFAELPVAREHSIEALGASPLVFPGASRADGVYTNLVLENLGSDGSDGSALVEVFDAGGALVGSLPVLVPGEGGFATLTLVDIVGLVGGETLDGGQVRVTGTTGHGALWGVLATVFRAGYLQVSVGANP